MILDLSHPIHTGMTVYPGDPEVSIDFGAGGEGPWRVSALRLGSHSGTHIDAPSHLAPGRLTIDALPLERFVGLGIIFDLQSLDDDAPIALEHLSPALSTPRPADFALLRTGWDRHWGREPYLRHPYLSRELAQALAEAGFTLIGVDALNVDSTVQSTSHAHEILLGKEILIVENLTGLDRLLAGHIYQFAFFPLRLAGADGSPVRALTWIV